MYLPPNSVRRICLRVFSNCDAHAYIYIGGRLRQSSREFRFTHARELHLWLIKSGERASLCAARSDMIYEISSVDELIFFFLLFLLVFQVRLYMESGVVVMCFMRFKRRESIFYFPFDMRGWCILCALTRALFSCFLLWISDGFVYGAAVRFVCTHLASWKASFWYASMRRHFTLKWMHRNSCFYTIIIFLRLRICVTDWCIYK